ncbi:ATPase [Paenibacillus psychroresistens]|uniref:ATPase n=1 Tax=Paenibacillus psychroresistens TaxID=1778678 RepID=A0A6B8RRT9_9BACL|nr:SRPBCC family protein [Paenibacillus psychroresistens]QGQ99100.1 ATPase [Paenibacillus psychroresistens]
MTKTTIIAEPGKQEIVITRSFDAARELVFKAFTNPDSISEWWGPRSHTTSVDKMEVRKGGVWRYVSHDSNGNEYAFNGVYHEIASPERIVNTYEFEGLPAVGLVTVTFEEEPGGKTKLTEVSLFPSIEIRDGVIQSGMAEGAIELMDRFEELLAKLQA